LQSAQLPPLDRLPNPLAELGLLPEGAELKRALLDERLESLDADEELGDELLADNSPPPLESPVNELVSAAEDDLSEAGADECADGDGDDLSELSKPVADDKLDPLLDDGGELPARDDRLDDVAGSLDWSCEDGDRLEGGSDEDGDRLEGGSDEDGCDEADGKDEALLLRTELPLGLDRGDELGRLDNSELDAERTLDGDDCGLEPLDFYDRDEPRLERLLGELFEERADEWLERELRDDRLDEGGLLESELLRLLLALLLDDDNDELDTLQADESLEELGDDSLTLENDLLDP